MLVPVGILLAASLFAFSGWYLTLIAKFYRQKFRKGPSHLPMQAALAVLALGTLLGLPAFAFLPRFLAPLCVCLGGGAFSALAYNLYRAMMRVD